MLKYIPDHLRIREMCNTIMRIMPEAFHRIPDRFKKQEMCIKVVEVDPLSLGNVFDHLKTREMCDAAVKEDSSSLIYVPDWFVTQQQVKLWHDDDDFYDDIMRLLSGTMVIKNVRPKRQKMKKSYGLLLGIHQDGGIGACQKIRKTDRKIVEVTDNSF